MNVTFSDTVSVVGDEGGGGGGGGRGRVGRAAASGAAVATAAYPLSGTTRTATTGEEDAEKPAGVGDGTAVAATNGAALPMGATRTGMASGQGRLADGHAFDEIAWKDLRVR